MGGILGLDLGTNSIGWAIVDDINNRIINTGVRIFPEGVVAKTIGKGEKEESKNAKRRNSRQLRRQFFRKRLRKIKLLRTLINLNMCPLENEELDIWSKWDKEKKKEGRMAPEIHLPENHSYCLWLKQNPYLLRDKALKEDLTLQEFGRVLYHLIQRRGFLSNRKGKEDGTLFKGKDHIKGYGDTQKELQDSTLGEYLFHILPKAGEPYRVIQDEEGNELRVRARYTLRDMYVAEFEAIWNRQTKNLGLDDKEFFINKNVFLNGDIEKNKRNRNKIEHLKKVKGFENVEVVSIKDELSNIERNQYMIKVKTKTPLKEFLAGKIEEGEEGKLKFKSNESVLFWQRPLRSQKGLLAKCRFEPDLKDKNGKFMQKGKTPCHLSHPIYEEFRAYQYINNIEYGKKQRLDENQRLEVLDLMNSKEGNFDFLDIKKKLKLDFEKFNYDDKQKVAGNYTTKNLHSILRAEVLRKEYLNIVNKLEEVEYGYEKIWHCFHYYEDNDLLIEKLKTNFELEEKSIDKVASINLKEGYSNVSLKAIKNILPYLREGKRFSDAVVLGGVRNAFGHKWEIYINDHKELEKDICKILKEKSNKEGEAIDKIKRYLIDNKYGFIEDDKRFIKLYHHSQDIEKVKIKDKIDTVENLRNPIVQQGVNEVRRLVNVLLKENGSFDQIRVELGRDLKNSKIKRQELEYKINENTNKNDSARELLVEYGLRQSRENIQKVLLYQEIQERGIPTCPYTNKTINISDVLGRENKIQIEHIIPWSISLDDSFANKTLCDAKFNSLKGERTPYDFYQLNKDPLIWGGAKTWEDIEFRAFKLLPYAKAKRFVSQTKFDKNDFIERQLNDTRYISKKAKEILSQVCEDVRVMPGSLTAELRKLWGLNNILQPAFTIDIPNLEVDFERVIPYYVVVDENKKPIISQKIYNSKPELYKNETTVIGTIDKKIFKSKGKYIKFEKEVSDFVNGEYWTKLKLSGPKKIITVFKEKPEVVDNEIIVIGKIEKGKFKYEKLNAIDAQGFDYGYYWAKLSVLKKKFELPKKGEQPKKNGKQILIFGEVKEGVFNSYHYRCESEEQDGKFWLLLDLDFENVVYEKARNDEPIATENQIVIQGTTNDENIFVSDMDNKHQFVMNEIRGKYYVLFDIESKAETFYPVKQEIPKLEDGQTLVEGNVWVDKYTGEIKFDPKKNRDDHRHHAVDALVIALTKERYFQEMSKYNSSIENKKRGIEYESLDFPLPWNDFHSDATNAIQEILVSHKQNINILTEVRKRITKNGKTYLSVGNAVRGQLHEETFYGKNDLCAKDEVIQRVPISKLKYAPTKGQASYITDIIDSNIRKIVIQTVVNKFKYILNKYNENNIEDEEFKIIKKKHKKEEITDALKKISVIEEMELTFNKLTKKTDILNKQKEINKLKTSITKLVEEFLQEESFFIPNEGKRQKRMNKFNSNDQRNPVPIKKVRIIKVLSKNERVNSKISQYVNPGNNHHVILYKNDKEDLKDDITTFWEVIERKKGNDAILKFPESKQDESIPSSIYTSFQENDMFIIGLEEELFEDKINDFKFLSKYLYRVQNISKMNFSFRHHLASIVTNDEEKIHIQSIGNWLKHNPIKVKISNLGKIQKV